MRTPASAALQVLIALQRYGESLKERERKRAFEELMAKISELKTALELNLTADLEAELARIS